MREREREREREGERDCMNRHGNFGNVVERKSGGNLETCNRRQVEREDAEVAGDEDQKSQD